MSSVRMIGRRLALLGLLAMTMAMAGCGGDDGGDSSGPTNIAGTYILRTYNNGALPATVFEQPGYKIEILSGRITLNANGTYSEAASIRQTINGTAQAPEPHDGNGTWTRSGNRITLNDSDPDEDDTVVTLQNDGALTITESFGGAPVTARFTK